MKLKVNKKTCLAVVLAGGMALSTLLVNAGSPATVKAASAERVQEIDKRIQEIEGKKKESEQERQQLESELKRLGEEKDRYLEELEVLEVELNRTVEEIETKEDEINETEDKAQQAARELKAAEKRVQERDRLLKTRVRAMYESGGNISYIEVLLGASSFGDFLQRVDFITTIIHHDQNLLEEHIRDQKMIAQKKKEIEQLLVQLEEQLEELHVLEARLERQQQEKRVQIASIEEEEEHLHEISEEVQEEMLRFVNEQSALLAEKKEIQAELKRMEEERKKAAQQAAAQQTTAKKGSAEKTSNSSPSASTPSGGQLAWPVPGYGINSSYGMRVHPISGKRKMHSGVDMSAPSGTAIVAAESGIVVHAGPHSSWGNHVIIDHGGGMQTLYAHIRDGGIKVSVGQQVSRGQKIAEVGRTGSATGNHLHFEVYINGKRVNPAPYLGL